ELVRSVVGFSDKRRALEKRQQWATEIRKQQQQQQQQQQQHDAVVAAAAAENGFGSNLSGTPAAPRGLTVFIGDSDGDIAALLHADIAILIGSVSSLKTFQICSLKVSPLRHLLDCLHAQQGAPLGAPQGAPLGAPKAAALQSCSYLWDGKKEAYPTAAAAAPAAAAAAAAAEKTIFQTDSWEEIYTLFFGAWPAQEEPAHANVNEGAPKGGPLRGAH
ncbi:hypothetical protein, conserved, partial [Eimeria tenella]